MISGCTDPIAFNYNINACFDDGSCCLIAGCLDSNAINYNANACFDDGSCIQTINGCTDSLANNYDPSANFDDGSCCYGDVLTIDITTDNYPQDISWQVVDQNGVVLSSINAASLTSANTSYTWDVCLSASECYDFIISDSYGDGLCCNYGNGSYSVSVNGSLVGSGAAFTSSDTVSSVGSCVASVLGCSNPTATNYDPTANTNLAFGAAIDNSFGAGGYFNGDQYLLFDSYKECNIKSALIYSEGSNTITFELRDNAGTVLDDTTLNVVQGQQRVTLNFEVPIGTDLQLGVASGALQNTGLYRNSSGTSYPYDIASALSITRSSASGNGGANAFVYYYFYYDLEVEIACLGAPSASWDCVNGACTDPGTGNGAYSTLASCQSECVNISTFDVNIFEFKVYPNPSNGTFNIKLDNINHNNIKIKLVSSIGNVISDKELFYYDDYNLNIDLKSHPKGVYLLEIITDKGTINKKLILQ